MLSLTRTDAANRTVTIRITAALVGLLLLFLSSACTRSLRPAAIKVATAGSTTAKQLGDYYDSLAQDTIRTWELNAFSDAYAVANVEAKFDRDIQRIDEQLRGATSDAERDRLRAERATAVTNRQAVLMPAPVDPARRQNLQSEAREVETALNAEKAKPEPDKNVIKVLEASLKQKRELAQATTNQQLLFALYRQRYEALRARKKVAVELSAVYDQFARLANYNASEDVRTKASELIGALNGVLESPIPDVSSSSNSLIGRAIGDVIGEIMTIQQNKAILKSSRRVVGALRNLQKFYEAEKVVYKSIPTIRASFSTQIAKNLVENSTVISTSLLADTLAAYELRWPDPQVPFTSKAMTRGVQGIIDARSKPLEKVSQDTADGLSKTFTKLITLHEELEEKKPLSFVEFAESSSAVSLLMEELKAHNVPAGDILKFFKALTKEGEND
jgi:hypothetical protein